MSKRVEIDMEKQNPVQKDEREYSDVRIDLSGLCKEMGLKYHTYQECYTCHKVQVDCMCKQDKRDLHPAYFLHEVGLDTGVKFTRKRDMAQQVLAFHASWAALGVTLVAWAGRRGLRVLTAMNAEDRAKVQRQRIALEAMREASAAGEMVNMEAGVAPVVVSLGE